MHTWDDAAALWLREKCFKATHAKDVRMLAWLAPYFAGLALTAITRDVVMVPISRKAVEASPATANRYLSLVRSILRRACRVWQWTERVPPLELYPEVERRVRWLAPAQALRLLAELPEHQRAVVLFALATGLRQANVVRLEWSQVDVESRRAWIHADQAKGRRSIPVPLNETACSVLRRCEGAHPVRVFTYRGRPFVQANTRAWRKALERAGIGDFRWHDLRHTWASWHVQHGTPLYVLQDLGAWRSEAMVRRYAHLAPAQYAMHAVTVDPLLRVASK